MLLLASTFLLLTALLLWVVIGSHGKWWLKLPFIVGVPLFSFLLWNSLATFSGFPTSQKLPKESQFISSYVQEPTPGNPGAIYLWVSIITHNRFGYNSTQPRAYKLPYSRQEQEQLQHAMPFLSKSGNIGIVQATDITDVNQKKLKFKLRLIPNAPPPKTNG